MRFIPHALLSAPILFYLVDANSVAVSINIPSFFIIVHFANYFIDSKMFYAYAFKYFVYQQNYINLKNIILQILMVIPFLNTIGIIINMFLQRRILFLGLSFNIIETLVFLLLIYISAGILAGKNVYVPFLTNVMNKVMKSYR